MTQQNAADSLIKAIKEKNNPTVVGLDPYLDQIPQFLKDKHANNSFEAARDVIINFNKAIIDAIYDIVPAVKPQIAFYEKYGSNGIIAFEETIKYAKNKGLFVITDGKRNDIGSTAQAYAEAHLGKVDLVDGSKKSSFDADYLTVNAYLGSDGIKPFIDVCKTYDKGVFALVKTSNPSASEFQDKQIKGGKELYIEIAKYINKIGKEVMGESGYSSIGAVVGATYPAQAKKLRKIMPKTIFLVPGYGAQGGKADDVMHCFNEDGLGAIVNSSR